MYHALQLTLKQQTWHGVFFVAGYTWSHAIDDASGNREFLMQNSYDPAAERGNADQDIRNLFTLATTYPLPSKREYWQMLSRWQVNNIFTAQDGEPLRFADFSDNISGTCEHNDRWNITGANLSDDVGVSQPTVGLPSYTPDVAASNPVVGSGGSRHIQLGVKVRW